MIGIFVKFCRGFKERHLRTALFLGVCCSGLDSGWGEAIVQLSAKAQAVAVPQGASQVLRYQALDCSEPHGFVSTVEAVQDRSLVGSGSYTVSLPRPNEGVRQDVPPRGAQVEVVRCLPPGRLVQIATGHIEKAEDALLIAAVFVPHALASQSVEVPQRTLVTHRNLYWRPMRGDLVRVLEPAVVHLKKAWAQVEFDLEEIFTTHPDDEGALLSLSAVGRKKLIEAFEPLEQHRGRFLIESEQRAIGGTDPSEWSEMRGGIVAELLSRVFEVQPERFVVRTLGGRYAAEEMVPLRFFGGRLSSGRIVIRVLPGE